VNLGITVIAWAKTQDLAEQQAFWPSDGVFAEDILRGYEAPAPLV
jgi:hypothetical protein